MADRFFDSSASVKHYLSETGTAKVDTFSSGHRDAGMVVPTFTIQEIALMS